LFTEHGSLGYTINNVVSADFPVICIDGNKVLLSRNLLAFRLADLLIIIKINL